MDFGMYDLLDGVIKIDGFETKVTLRTSVSTYGQWRISRPDANSKNWRGGVSTVSVVRHCLADTVMRYMGVETECEPDTI